MMRRTLLAGIVAGLIAGLAGFLVQSVAVTPLIQQAETHEAAARAQAALAESPGGVAITVHAPPHPVTRHAVSLLAALSTGAGFGLLLAGAVAIAGRRPGPLEGVVWGAAGFASFALAPALVLPPHLPGMAEGDLVARQLWWLASAATMGGGLALAAFARPAWLRAAAALPIVLTFLLPGPSAPPASGAALAAPLPPGLVAGFVSASLAALALFWAVLGLALSLCLARFSRDSRAL